MCSKDEMMHDERDLDRALARVELLQGAIKLALSDLRLPTATGGGVGQVETRLRAALTATQPPRGSA